MKLVSVNCALLSVLPGTDRSPLLDSAFRAERGRLNAEQQDAEEARGVKTAPNGAAITSPAAAETARPAISTPDAAANEDAASEAGSEGGLFGTMLDELPTSETDASGSIIRIRSLPASKSGAGGKSPRSLLSESLRRIDPFAVTHYAPLGGGSRACRSALTIRWVKQSKRVAVYRMSGEGAPTQNAADDLVATLALNCIERERPVYRALPPGYREWWDELEEARKEERDRKGRDTVRRMKDVLKSRVEEALAKKGKTKATGTPNEGQVQTQVDELVRNVRPVSESVSEELRTKFEEKTQGAAYQKMLVSYILS